MRRAALLPLLVACGPAADLPSDLPTDLPTDGELARTPRADIVAEDVALRSTPDRWTADDDRYVRVAADLSAIALALPQTAFFTREPERAQNAGVEFAHDDDDDVDDAAGVAALVEFFGGEARVDISESFVIVEGSWRGLLQPQKVNAAIDEIVDAELLRVGADVEEGPIIDVDVDGDAFRYRFLRYGGDCPEGCTELQAFYVETAPGIAPVLLDSFDTNVVDVCPDWAPPRCPISP